MSSPGGHPDIVGNPRRPRQTVVAAVIVRDGQVLICQRRRGDRHPLKWEFPGGKVESGESPPAALQRELTEELAIRARIGLEITRYEYEYSGRPPVLLIFYRVEEFEGEPVNLAFERFLWESPRRLLEYDFLEGDTHFVQSLSREADSAEPRA